MKPSEILRAQKALIDTPEKWTGRVFARDAAGNPIQLDSPKAVCFCSSGALRLSPMNFPGSALIFGAAVDFLRRAMRGSITVFNDTKGHKAVISAWDRAIAAAEKAEVA